MAIDWYDGFETYGQGGQSRMLDGLWLEVNHPADQSVEVVTPGAAGSASFVGPVATGQYALRMNSAANMRRSLSGDFTTVGVAQRWYFQYAWLRTGSFTLMQFRNQQNFSHIAIQLGSTGRVYIVGGGLDSEFAGYGTILAQSTLELAAGTYNHIEAKCVLNATTGSVEVRVNGKSFVTYSGNTIRASSGDPTIAQIAVGAYQTNFFDGQFSFNGFGYLDDMVTWNGSTADNMGGTNGTVDFIGQYGVYWLPPNADSTPQNWGLTVGTHAYSLVNETPPDDDTNFIFASTTGLKTEMVPSPLPANIFDIRAITPQARMRKTDTGDCGVKLGTNSSGTEQLGPENEIVTSWDYFDNPVQEFDPHTSSRWNPLALPNMVADRTL